MASRLSGSPKDKELVVIETAELTCIIKGTATHPQYNKLHEHMPFKVEDSMQFQCRAESLDEVQLYNVMLGELVPYSAQQLLPIFFENGRYEIIILPKTEEQLTFYHEFPEFRNAVSKISRRDILTGTLHFRNEVGLTSFEVRGSHQRILLSVVLEVFPTKLDYKKDYKALLDEVNEEIYNLAYHFIKRTYLQGSAKIYKEPSLAEFYRLIELHYGQYKLAIERIEKTSHRQLRKNYVEVRGDKLKRQDSRSLAYLRKNAGMFIEVPNGIPFHGRSLMPTKGLSVRKEHTADTHENRYVKWTMQRIVTRFKDLKRVIEKAYFRGYGRVDNDLLAKLDSMIEWVEKREKNLFWRGIGMLDRSVVSLVLQMAPGYRNVLQVYTTISKSIVLQGEIYKMSVKDIATLYEYWTFLKLGRLLDEKCTPISQDFVKVNSEGLFVNLNKSRTAERKYVHPVTKEEITLKYQFDTTSNRVPTVQQKPDTMLSIGKKGKEYQYQYIFDAKYRLDLETNPNMPGPMQDDVNTMHRYRDSIVVNTDGRYERTAFGAYVLFPWNDEQRYKDHPLYESIDSVNIGGFPFLPNATTLVDRFIDNLLNKSPAQLQQEGILPKGSYEEIENSYSVDQVLICAVQGDEELHRLLTSKGYVMQVVELVKGWQRMRYIAIYEEETTHIRYYAEVTNVEIDGLNIYFKVSRWQQKLIEGKGYRIHNQATVYANNFLRADMLANLHSKTEEEDIIWKITQRISNDVRVNLDDVFVDRASQVVSFTFDKYILDIHNERRQLEFSSDGFKEILNMDLILENESFIFKRLIELIYPN
ncbi:restriction endonuclease-like protein [Sporosarcina sp. Marseille-Q4063]|uniref:restriction endonuclease-like protein n=1 Tax=Sporosarcina sp. Marseille-Q4063 TaxID=2810514 RepID=UPI001BAF25F1|nr:restriction endonuclease-like protein [Sporosarcina sp. Marseille-Q4063]QUW20479.1 restriction endonuclease-like protein [Sporosarcina sp. Marseille-Q4063]